MIRRNDAVQGGQAGSKVREGEKNFRLSAECINYIDFIDKRHNRAKMSSSAVLA